MNFDVLADVDGVGVAQITQLGHTAGSIIQGISLVHALKAQPYACKVLTICFCEPVRGRQTYRPKGSVRLAVSSH